MASNSSIQDVARVLREGESFVIGAHLDPDGDTLGSSLALCHHLRSRGKRVRLFCDNPAPANLDILPGLDMLEVVTDSAQVASASGDVGLAVDAGDIHRLGNATQAIESCHTLVNIDHHPTNPLYGAVNLVDPSASSTAELVYRVLRLEGAEVGLEIAQCLYIGVASDTGCFRYANTTPAALEMGSHLVELGVSASHVAENLYERRTFGFLKLLGAFLGRLVVEENGLIAWSALDLDTVRAFGVADDELDGLSSYPRMIDGTEIAIVLREADGGRVKVSLRSRDAADVSGIARALGGGGHRRAAGATVIGSLEAVTQRVLDSARLALRRPQDPR